MNPDGYDPNDLARELGNDAAEEALDDMLTEYTRYRVGCMVELQKKLNEINSTLDTMRAEMCDELAAIWDSAANTVRGCTVEGDPADYLSEFQGSIRLEELEDTE